MSPRCHNNYCVVIHVGKQNTWHGYEASLPEIFARLAFSHSSELSEIMINVQSVTMRTEISCLITLCHHFWQPQY